MCRAILLYDGLCGLCDHIVQFTLHHDRDDVFRFAPLQSEAASVIVRRHGVDTAALNTVVLVLDPELPTERLQTRSDAALGVLFALGAPWKFLAGFGQLCPQAIRDYVYNWAARRRYRGFGRFASCPVPAPAQRHKFLG